MKKMENKNTVRPLRLLRVLCGWSFLKKILNIQIHWLLIILLISFFSHTLNAQNIGQLSTKQSVLLSKDLSKTGNEHSKRSAPSVKNVFLSLILPGAGEWAVGEKKLAKIFLGTEITLMLSYFGSRAYARVLERDFHAFAATHAFVDTYHKSEQYWIDIGNASNIYEFNEKKRVQRNLKATYPETPRYYWQWDAERNRIKYINLRSKQHSWEKTATFVIGGMILNRVVSMIDVVRIVRKGRSGNNRKHTRLYWQYLPKTSLTGEGIQMTFSVGL